MYEPDDFQQPQPDYSRQITNLAKLYTEEDKYSGQSDNSFNFKLGIFIENCKKARVLPEARGLAFLIILTGLAKDYYYKSCCNYDDVDLVYEAISKWFETDEQGRLNLLN